MNSFDTTGSYGSRSHDSSEKLKRDTQQLSPSDSENSDIEFDDTPLQTPQALRESSRSMLERATTTEIPLNDRPYSLKKKTPTKFIKNPSDRDLIANEKLISDDNQFTPHAVSGSPGRIPRLQWSNRKVNTTDADDFQQNSNVSDEEFDSSEDEKNESQKSQTEPREELPAVSESLKLTIARSPRKSSPLRNEIKPSSSSPSERYQEERVRPPNVNEMLRLMNSDLDKLRSQGLADEMDYEDQIELDEEPESSDDDEEAMRNLDTLLPSRSSRTGTRSPVHVTTTVGDREFSRKADNGATSLFSQEQGIPDLQDNGVSREVPKDDFWKESSPTRNGKLAGANRKRMNAKSLRLNARKDSIIKEPTSHAAWSAEQWSKLARLVELSIPNDVIATSNIVVRELGCRNKAELAKRVAFLEQYLSESP